MKLMKRVWAALLLLAASGQLYADEGMWVLKELNKQNLARMAELGFTPSYDQLYSGSLRGERRGNLRWGMYRYYGL